MGTPAELAANETTGETLAPETDMLVEEEGPGEGAKAKVLKEPDQPTAAEIEQHDQTHLHLRRSEDMTHALSLQHACVKRVKVS
eukprot:2740403-Amphidinium_carterae.1